MVAVEILKLRGSAGGSSRKIKCKIADNNQRDDCDDYDHNGGRIIRTIIMNL